jgi:small subunit ribosomal protein S9
MVEAKIPKEVKETPKVEAKPQVVSKEVPKVENKEIPKEVLIKEVPKKRTVRRKPKAGKPVKHANVKAKRKTAIARAVVRQGKGRITINKRPYTIIENKYLLGMIQEPLNIVNNFNPEFLKKVDIVINVTGGGQISQMVSSRGCIAKGLVKYYDNKDLEKAFLVYDRTLLVDDVRRKEAKKPLGRGARAKWQSSKR